MTEVLFVDTPNCARLINKAALFRLFDGPKGLAAVGEAIADACHWEAQRRANATPRQSDPQT